MFARSRQQINHNKLNVAYPGRNKAKYSEISRELLRNEFVAVIKRCERPDTKSATERGNVFPSFPLFLCTYSFIL